MKRVILILLLVVLPTAQTVLAQTAPAAKPHPLEQLLVVEAEDSHDVNGAPLSGRAGVRSKLVYSNNNAEASGGGFITPLPMPYRAYQLPKEPVEAVTEVDVPRAGRWYAHVNYFITPDHIRKAITGPKPSTRFKAFGPFTLIIGTQTFTCGANQEAGAAFRWDRFPITLPAGRVPIRFRMTDLSGIDCLVFTQNPEYNPEVDDFNGPIWMRFKVLKGPEAPFYIRCRSHINPYAGDVQDAGFLVKDEVLFSASDAAKRKDGLLQVGEWSPWVKMHESKARFWYTQVMVMPGPGKVDTGTRKYGYNNVQIAFQASMSADPRFVIHQTIEDTGGVRGMQILMPTDSSLEGIRRGVMTFTEWSDSRLQIVKDLGIKLNEGPRRIKVMTDAYTPVTRDVDVFIETCQLLGFNGIDMSPSFLDSATLWKRIRESGFSWTATHHLAPVYELKWKEAPTTAAAGKSLQQTVDEFIYDRTMNRIRRLWNGRPEEQRRLLEMAILVDEPGPMPQYLMINNIPALKACFHEFLRANGLTPASFGKANWDDVEAMGYSTRASGNMQKILAEFGVELQYITPSKSAPVDDEVAAAEQKDEPVEPDGDGTKPTTMRRVQVPIVSGLHPADLNEKKLYYWTQRFRSFFTRHFYGQGAKAIEDLKAQGWLRDTIKASPNFQAAPIMEVRMWDGGFNLFEWAREGTTNCLLVEDWINDFYRVSFGFNLLNAAARKHGQSLAHLIVADRHFRQRYLAGLAAGVQTFYDYSYGPLIVKGPAWASNPTYVRDWAEMLRWTRRCEDDLLASRLRPADAAILVANPSEVNAAFYNSINLEAGLKTKVYTSRPMYRRAGLYMTLLDSNIPVEVVSEEEILEDKALGRYKVLYVVDTHVSAPVQAAIKQWVQGGGTLWADHTAIARDEFDQPSGTLDPVFGLASRGALPDPMKAQEKDVQGEKITVAAGEKLSPVTMIGSAWRPGWKVSTGEAVGTFADGSPAIIRNRFGKGQALLVGCSALSLSTLSENVDDPVAFANVRRVVELGAELSGVARHCRVSIPRVTSVVRDGANQTVLVLINATGQNQTGVTIRLTVPQAVKKAFDGRGQAVTFQQTGNEVKLTRNLADDDGEIIVFKW